MLCQTLLTFFRNVGMLTVEEAPGNGLKEILHSLIAAGESFQVLSNKQLKERFPELSFPPHYTGVLEHSAGILRADQCLRVLQVGNICVQSTELNEPDCTSVPALSSSFCSLKHLARSITCPLDGMVVHCRVTPPPKKKSFVQNVLLRTCRLCDTSF